MRKLYEINRSIEELLETVTDPETGEICDMDALDDLLLEKEQKIESVILYYKDVMAEADAIGDEMNVLNQRYERLRTTADGLKGYINNALCGEKFKTARCEVSYRKSVSVDVDDWFCDWAYLQNEDMSEYITHTESDKPNKAAIKQALKDGKQLEHCRLVEKQNISIK